jgi:succinylglutamate desuccinylase
MEFSTHLLEFDSLVKDLRRKGMIQEQLADRCFVLRGEPSAFLDTRHDIGLCVLGLIHGNEYGGLGVINKLLLGILQGTHRPLFPLGVGLGNIPAGFENVRFTEKDLNRVFTSSSSSTYEERRALELEPLIKRSRFLIDLHQTIEPTTSPFFILGFNEDSLQFANELDSGKPIVDHV